MKSKRIWSDPGLWVLVALNTYLVWYYYGHPGVFTTLVFIYWAQSVLLGFFNFADILTVRSIKKDNSTSSSFLRKGPTAFFFLFHYGFFHVVYLVFIFSMKGRSPIDWYLFKYCFYAFLVSQIITFIQHKRDQRKTQSSLIIMFFVPYLRIIPMHLTILLPAFFHVSDVGLFLILKSIADVLMYLLTKPAYGSREATSAMLTQQQNTTL